MLGCQNSELSWRVSLNWGHVIWNKPETKSFAAVFNLVKNCFKPNLSEATASLLFYSRRWQKEECSYVFSRTTVPCNFRQFVTRALRDRCIFGINDERIQKDFEYSKWGPYIENSIPDSRITRNSMQKCKRNAMSAGNQTTNILNEWMFNDTPAQN